MNKYSLALTTLVVLILSALMGSCGGSRGRNTTAHTAGNTAPVANTGPDQNVATGSQVTLDGRNSSDVDGNMLTYGWSFTAMPAGSTTALSSSIVVNPTFTPDKDGAYVLSLVVNDGQVSSAADTITVTAATANSTPVANAGPDQNAATGSLVALDGSGSSDANGDMLTYSWTFLSMPASSTATLSNATAANPSYTADKDGTYVLSLVVNDGMANSAADSVTITVATANSAPVANAGSDQNVATGSQVTLDGRWSSDVDGDTLTYSWSFTSIPDGSTAALSSTTVVNPTFTADKAGAYVLSLIVNDGTANSAADTVMITATTANSAPVANAGPDQNVATGSLIELDGRWSSDVDGDTLTYSWSFISIPDGSAAALSSSTAVNPTFTADKDGSYVLSLTVNDGKIDSVTDTVTITAETANSAPVANAGIDQNVATGSLVTLDGSVSNDVDGDTLTYSWSFTSIPVGSAAALSSSTAVDPTFTADKDGAYVLNLIVNDGKIDSTTDTVMITAATPNAAPVANAGPDQNVAMSSLVTLDGSNSSDANSDMLTYAWSFTSIPAGSTATLSGATTVSPTFTADKRGAYVLGLVVNDGTVNSVADTVMITAADTAPPSVPTALTATAVSSSRINLLWAVSTDNVGVVGYKIYRNGRQIGTTTATTFANIGLVSSTTYTYSVAAYDAAGNRSVASSAAHATTSPGMVVDTQAPTAPTGLIAMKSLVGGEYVSWLDATDNVGVTGYEVYRNATLISSVSGTSFLDTGLTSIPSGTVCTFLDPNISSGASYTYTIKAFDAKNNKSSASASATIMASCYFGVPADLYCEALRYTSTSDGYNGFCVFPDQTSCETWSLFWGNCGQAFTHCERNGFTLEARLENMGTWTGSYSACIFDDGSVCREEDYLYGTCGPSQCKTWTMLGHCVAQ